MTRVIRLLLGGALNVGLVLRRGLPAVLGRRRQMMAIVMAAQGEKIEARDAPGTGEPIERFLSTDARIPATGKAETVDGVEWTLVHDQTGDFIKAGWQEHSFAPAAARFIKVEGAGRRYDPDGSTYRRLPISHFMVMDSSYETIGKGTDESWGEYLVKIKIFYVN